MHFYLQRRNVCYLGRTFFTEDCYKTFRMLFCKPSAFFSFRRKMEFYMAAEICFCNRRICNFCKTDSHSALAGQRFSCLRNFVHNQIFITSLAAQVIFETTSPLQIQNSLELIQNGISKLIPPIKNGILRSQSRLQ